MNDITGKTIMQTAATTIDLSQFDDGLYFFNIQDENGNTKTVKVQLMHR